MPDLGAFHHTLPFETHNLAPACGNYLISSYLLVMTYLCDRPYAAPLRCTSNLLVVHAITDMYSSCELPPRVASSSRLSSFAWLVKPPTLFVASIFLSTPSAKPQQVLSYPKGSPRPHQSDALLLPFLKRSIELTYGEFFL